MYACSIGFNHGVESSSEYFMLGRRVSSSKTRSLKQRYDKIEEFSNRSQTKRKQKC